MQCSRWSQHNASTRQLQRFKSLDLCSTQAKPDARRAFLVSKPNHTQQTVDVVASLKSQLQDPSQHRTNKATT
jgi:hypothetical protein